MQHDTHAQFSRITIALHWVVGLFMVGLFGLGRYMTETKTFSLYPWHKSFGFLIFFIVVLRVVWRIKNGWPVAVGQYSKVEQVLSKIVHWVLIIGTLIMPISGFLAAAVGGHGVDFFGLEVVARNVNPEDLSKVIAHNERVASIFHTMHHRFGDIFMAAVVLHILGALKHHIVDKDGTLRRIFGLKISQTK